VTAQFGPASWHHTDGHDLTIERRIRLCDRLEVDTSGQQAHSLLLQGCFVRNLQNDCESSLFEIPGTRLASCVNDLGGEDSYRKVTANNDVVRDRVSLKLNVNAKSSCCVL